MTMEAAAIRLSPQELRHVHELRNPVADPTNWCARTNRRFGYYAPDEHYEAAVARLLAEGGAWLDVGSGRMVFPNNPALARRLADRCRSLVGVDPDDNIHDNPFVHRRVQCTIDAFHTDETFDLVTLRMVAEHVADPEAAVGALARLTRHGGRVVIYTVNKRAPLALLAALLPMRLHHLLKRLVWRTQERDTFPVVYRMNTRRQLRRLFTAHGFSESSFTYLDDAHTFHHYPVLHVLELTLWRLLRAVGLRYPENCLLGVYERR
jgi:2-polyprenyl-3-methyl-5-hydroxy-6-metoxy-1,4-benzoquinol methylase